MQAYFWQFSCHRLLWLWGAQGQISRKKQTSHSFKWRNFGGASSTPHTHTHTHRPLYSRNVSSMAAGCILRSLGGLSRMTVPEPGVAPRKVLSVWCRLCLAQVPTEGQRNLQPSPAPLAKSCLCLPTYLCPHEGVASSVLGPWMAGRGGDNSDTSQRQPSIWDQGGVWEAKQRMQ